MKKFRNTLAIIALATVAMFSAQTAKAQNNNESTLPKITTFEKVYPNGSVSKVTCDFHTIYYDVFCNPQYKETIKGLMKLGRNATAMDVYNAFMGAGLDDGNSWIISEIYKMQPDLFTFIYYYTGGE